MALSHQEYSLSWFTKLYKSARMAVCLHSGSEDIFTTWNSAVAGVLMTSWYSDTARQSQVTHVANYRQVCSACSFTGSKVHLHSKVKTGKLESWCWHRRAEEEQEGGDEEQWTRDQENPCETWICFKYCFDFVWFYDGKPRGGHHEYNSICVNLLRLWIIILPLGNVALLINLILIILAIH